MAHFALIMEDKDVQGIFFKDFYSSYIPHIMKEIWIDNVYAQFFYDKNDLTVLDIGANIGIFSYYAYPYAKKIYSLEPSSQHFEVLTKMVEFNKLGDKVNPLKLALSGKNGTAKFYHNANSTMFSLSPAVNNLPDEEEEVETVTLEKLLTDQKIDKVDVLKLDVEGEEMNIIGSEGFAKVADKVDLLVGEFHNWNGFNPDQLRTTLTDLGFNFEWVSKTEASLFVGRRE